MKILAVDSATESCSVAVVDDGVLKAEFTDVSGQTHSRHLMSLVDMALSTSGLKLHQMDGIAVTRGPGSFTGLRIGISVVKGMAMAADKPLAGISCLEALAWQVGETSRLICPMMDARRNEVYFSAYRWMDGKLIRQFDEQVGGLETALGAVTAPCILVGNGGVRYGDEIARSFSIDHRFAPPFMNVIRAATVAYLGELKLSHGRADELGAFTPVYLRKSDAEINLNKDG